MDQFQNALFIMMWITFIFGLVKLINANILAWFGSSAPVEDFKADHTHQIDCEVGMLGSIATIGMRPLEWHFLVLEDLGVSFPMVDSSNSKKGN